MLRYLLKLPASDVEGSPDVCFWVPESAPGVGASQAVVFLDCSFCQTRKIPCRGSSVVRCPHCFGEVAVRLVRLDEDWFTHWFEVGQDVSNSRPVDTWVHELNCDRDRCAHEPGPCRFHPDGCQCSNGACQQGDFVGVRRG